MYYLTDIDTDGKVNNIVNLPSEEYIGFLGWDRAEKEQTGVFVEELPATNEGNYTSTTLYVIGKMPCWKYGDIIAPSAPLIDETTLLKAQNKALSDRLEFTEDLIAEMAMKVYAE